MDSALGGEAIRRGSGDTNLTRHRSALVAVLACASLAAVTFAAEAAATRNGAKSSHAATAKAVGKTAKATGKKRLAAGKSKDKKSAADKPAALAVPLAQGPAPQTPEAEVALVKSAIGALRSGGASKATEVAATISDPAARKLVEWIILRSDHNGAQQQALPRLYRRQSRAGRISECSAAAPRACSGSRMSSRRRR